MLTKSEQVRVGLRVETCQSQICDQVNESVDEQDMQIFIGVSNES